MELRPLGKTGLKVSALGFGCGDVGGLMVRGDPAEQRRTVQRALDAGINFFDTSDSYGRGRSEEVLGEVLRELHAEPLVATKVTRSDHELADGGATIRANLEGSLRRLGRDHVDVFLLHGRVGSAEGLGEGGMSPELVLGPIADGMVAARDAGLTRFIGFNGLGNTDDLQRVADLGIWDAAHCYFNALNPSAGWAVTNIDQQNFGGLIPYCARLGIAPIAIRVYAAGALAGAAPRHPTAGGGGRAMVSGGEFDADQSRAARLASMAEEMGLESPLELSLRLALAQPDLSTILLGSSDLAQLEQSLKWAERGALSASQVSEVLALYR
jgi:L-galactose dehydrogenase/L-glyceraldehyde 3-phosphate reductase